MLSVSWLQRQVRVKVTVKVAVRWMFLQFVTAERLISFGKTMVSSANKLRTAEDETLSG